MDPERLGQLTSTRDARPRGRRTRLAHHLQRALGDAEELAEVRVRIEQPLGVLDLLMREAIRGAQRRSEALGGAQRHPKALCGTQHTFSSSVGGKTANGTSVGARALPPSPSPSPSPSPALGSPPSGTGRNLRPR